jgi:hypothetical protein
MVASSAFPIFFYSIASLHFGSSPTLAVQVPLASQPERQTLSKPFSSSGRPVLLLCEAMKKANPKCEVIASSSRTEATRKVRKNISEKGMDFVSSPMLRSCGSELVI